MLTRTQKALVRGKSCECHLFNFRGNLPDQLLLCDTAGKASPSIDDPSVYDRRIDVLLRRRIDDGGFRVEDGKIVEEMFSYVNPEEPFDDFNTQLTGISAETVADAPTFPELWKKIEGMMGSGILVAHNAPFDMGVLKKCLEDYGIRWIWENGLAHFGWVDSDRGLCYTEDNYTRER